MRHPEVPWVHIYPYPGGGALVVDVRTGARADVATDQQLHEFAARAARAPSHYGAGDAVAAVTSRLGIQKCAPCARRQAALNRAIPRLWRRL